MKKKVQILFYILLVFFLVSCTGQRRLNRLLDRHPNLKEKEIVIVKDTISVMSPYVQNDTIFHFSSLRTDTIVINKEQLSVRTWMVHDSVYLQAECDTIVQNVPIEIPIEVEKIIYRCPRDGLTLGVLGLLLFIIGMYLYLRPKKN